MPILLCANPAFTTVDMDINIFKVQFETSRHDREGWIWIADETLNKNSFWGSVKEKIIEVQKSGERTDEHT